jgi:hypothetical protein
MNPPQQNQQISDLLAGATPGINPDASGPQQSLDLGQERAVRDMRRGQMPKDQQAREILAILDQMR